MGQSLISKYSTGTSSKTPGGAGTHTGHTRDTRAHTRLPGATDNTRYGEGRASPRTFLTHHVANISTAIQTADAQTILNAASARMLRVSFGVMSGVCILSGQ